MTVVIIYLRYQSDRAILKGASTTSTRKTEFEEARDRCAAGIFRVDLEICPKIGQLSGTMGVFKDIGGVRRLHRFNLPASDRASGARQLADGFAVPAGSSSSDGFGPATPGQQRASEYLSGKATLNK
jgi:hypothetical protein